LGAQAGNSKSKVNVKRASSLREETVSLSRGDLQRLVFHDVDLSRLDDFVTLFESRGGPKSCWCMVWRATPQEAKHTDGASRKTAFTRRVTQGVPVGIVGYLDGKPVAWCSIAPRSTYRELGGAAAQPGESVWSLVCFFVVREYRGQGITARLIHAAVEHARQRGATIVEAYPVDPDSPSYRFMGFISAFKKAGFVEMGRAGTRRHVMRLKVGRPKKLKAMQP
jgi:GNAT superfamily N-acetyltransferase